MTVKSPLTESHVHAAAHLLRATTADSVGAEVRLDRSNLCSDKKRHK